MMMKRVFLKGSARESCIPSAIGNLLKTMYRFFRSMKLEIRNGVRTGQEIKEILQLRWTRLEPMVREAFYIEARRRKAVFKEVSTRVQVQEYQQSTSQSFKTEKFSFI